MTASARRGIAAWAAGAAALLVLAGCGGDTDVSEGQSATDSAETHEPTSMASIETVEPASAASTSDSGVATEASGTAPATTGSPAPSETRPEILLLDAPQLDGQPFDLAKSAGNDVLLWFWAPW